MGDLFGYDYGRVGSAPYSLEDLKKLQQVVGWTEEDEKWRKKAGEVLKSQVEDLLDLWYNFVGSVPHLLYYFSDFQGQPVSVYLENVRKRFGQWILDTCFRPYDQVWLDYQYEIGLRHHRQKKNQTDQVETPPHIPLRYLIALSAPICLTVRSFLEKKGGSPEEVEKMYSAWVKSVLLQVALWSYPYTKEGEW